MAQNKSWIKYLVSTIKIAASVCILYWLYSHASKEKGFSDLISNPKLWHWLFVGFTLCFLAHLISYIRWGILVRALGIEFSTNDATRIGFIGLFFGLFAFGVVGGDSLRIYYAARQEKNRLADIFCSVFIDRALGMLAMFTFATIGYAWVGVDYVSADPEKLRNVQLVCKIIAAATLVGWIIIAVYFFTPGLADNRLIKWLKQLPKVGAIFGQLMDSALLYREKISVVLTIIGLSVLVNLCFVGAVFFLAMGLGVVHPPFAKHFVIAPISMAANAIPLPGGIGGMESMLAFFYAALSSTDEIGPGFVVAIGFRIMLLILAAIGSIAWFANRAQISSLGRDSKTP